MKDQMEQEMRQFFDMKIVKENRLKSAKQQFAGNHFQDII